MDPNLAAGGCVSFGAGKYWFTTASTYTILASQAGITLAGVDESSTILYFPGSSGLTFTLSSSVNSLHVRDLSMTTAGVGSSPGLTLNGYATVPTPTVQSSIERVALRGDTTAYPYLYWSFGVILSQAEAVKVNALLVQGGSSTTGVGLNLSSSTIVTIANSTFFNLAVGVLGNESRRVVGIEFCIYERPVEQLHLCDHSNDQLRAKHG